VLQFIGLKSSLVVIVIMIDTSRSRRLHRKVPGTLVSALRLMASITHQPKSNLRAVRNARIRFYGKAVRPPQGPNIYVVYMK